MQQNHVSVVRKLELKNTSSADLKNIIVEIVSEPEFTTDWKSCIDFLPMGQTFAFDAVNPIVSVNFLSGLTERLSGQFTLKVTADDKLLSNESYPVTILAYDQWNGTSMLPEMVAAFVTPNHSEVLGIIVRAAQILGKWTGSPSFDEYQTRNPDRVLKQMAAIYEAIAEKQIVYASVPASFEEAGQRVRLCDTIFLHKLANCLDLSLLYAASLEAVGINPLIVYTKGHAFAGGWLIDESFADPVNDDPALLTKRTANGIHEIALIECTCMSAGNNSSFEDAMRAANYKMVKPDEFSSFVDIKRARFGGIRPLPLRVSTAGGYEIIADTTTVRNSFVPVTIEKGFELVDTETIKISKQRLWERKLLDLTLRNNLLSLRITKGTVQFISVDLGKLEDALAGGDEIQVLPKPSDWANLLKNSGVYQAINQTDPVNDLVRKELTQKRLRSYLSEGELVNTLTSIYRSSRQSIEENGANTLYISLGMLKWYETAGSERARYAPILLLPVEIIKKSAQKGFIIRSREEETMMNITLLEMLRQDFDIHIGGLENLPKDDSGVDVQQVFNIIRRGIMAKTRWDVEEQAFLGTFSFSKFILWNDIHNNSDQLSENKIVKSLISGKLEWQVDQTLGLDINEINPSEISLPISTDSSQLQAILSSSEGKSFVLHGPPGTGKSQTITNIIANAVYSGKKVLFVAAKKAALEVVESRLEAIGIGPFCLELHSNKSKKSAILEQLKKAIEVTKLLPAYDFQNEAERLLQSRSELNGYVKALHFQHSFGLSLFDTFNKFSQIQTTSETLFFSSDFFLDLTPVKKRQLDDLVEEIQITGKICNHPHKNPLEGISITEFSQSLKNEAKVLLTSYRNLLAEYDSSVAQTLRILKLNQPIVTREQADILDELTTLFIKFPDVPARFFTNEHLEQTLSSLIGIAEIGLLRDKFRKVVFETFTKNVFTLDAEQLLVDWHNAGNKWFIPKLLKQNAIVKKLKSFSLNGNLNKDQISEVLGELINLKDQQSKIDKAVYLPELLGFLWKDGDCDWEQIIEICNSVLAINRKFSQLSLISNARDWRLQIASEFYEGSSGYLSKHQKTLVRTQNLSQGLRQKETELNELLGINFKLLDPIMPNWNESNHAYIDRWQNSIDGLKDWVSWLLTVQKANAAGLSPLVSAYGRDEIQGNDVLSFYNKGFYRSAAIHIIDKDPLLASFNGRLFEEKIKKFRQISTQFESLTKQELYARLASKIPSSAQEASQTSEMGILQRNIRNNGRATSIRKLFDSIPNLLPRLTPCMLMSPISVAQYFDAGTTKFDLVIFDEASQLPTCEAVGAIARGTNVIVVGDPKQMPPTSFFATNNVDEENIDIEDMESILDDCLALSMPSHYLLWHYRSKHESLIAFSNAKYYENKLLTFPSTGDITSMVKHVSVKGYYDKGKTRQNLAEAKAIVDEIVMRLSNPLLSTKSIGVVTFSVVQQNLIEDLLFEVFKTRPDLEKIALESQEPLFIKNLENVQGDERDVILFSICYGPDSEGKLSMNFGPINREGGWRRLNVAVSRARYEMKVFATLTSDQIDITRTASEGVAGLKAFLVYAERGKTALPIRSSHQLRGESSFENVLAAKIEALGYQVHTNIGCSDFKIDIGIVNPLNSSEYLLGIMCDGYNYNNAKTPRDREIVQKDVLSMLGWTIHKVWSMDWWENPQRTIQQIVEAIERAKNQEKAEPPFVELLEDVKYISEGNKINQEAETDQVDLHVNDQVTLTEKYDIAIVETFLASSSEDFLQPHNKAKVVGQILQILERESPVSKNLLSKRLLAAWGISRIGSRAASHIESILPTVDMKITQKGKNVILWKQQHNPSEYSVFRISELESHKRDADDLPPEEVANAVRYVLINQISLPKTELIRETSKILGYARTGSNLEAAMSSGIDYAVFKGYCFNSNDRIVLTEN